MCNRKRCILLNVDEKKDVLLMVATVILFSFNKTSIK